ncbi:alpha/beta hydrolase [Bradyrhizobium brasilense]|uniref:alpha/beta fold hydrolase n=1 Tax=Bradyrhizobium brasilense TaxID=1419277 RepID=UPI0014574FFE|nr:alpha/beta hydrolase [Bradyrhizobium brasilense]NLS68202.1 alpha/beta hydrolase [Bradyrhizobium brasilense]
MVATLAPPADRLKVRDIDLEVVRRGSGRTVLFLHGFHPLDADARFLERLSEKASVLAPSHPGFGDSTRPADFETVYDLVHLYRELADGLGDDKITLVGASFGGWLAAEIAASRPAWLDRLVLIDALGLKLRDRETPDILDIFNTHPDTVRQLSWHHPDGKAPDFDEMSDEALTRHARDWDALCLYGWEPYMYNPRLKRWLSGIAVPTSVLWGASDRLVAPDYGRSYAALIPGARFALIEGAGHHPERERPDALADRVLDFLGR